MASSLFLDLNTMFSPSLVELFDVIFFCGVFVETDELWVYDPVLSMENI